jgi:hypothetical protein
VVRLDMALTGLVHLGKASNKGAVLKAFNRSFIFRDQRPEKQPLEAYVTEFGLSEPEARELASGLQALIKPILYTGDVSPFLSLPSASETTRLIDVYKLRAGG